MGEALGLESFYLGHAIALGSCCACLCQEEVGLAALQPAAITRRRCLLGSEEGRKGKRKPKRFWDGMWKSLLSGAFHKRRPYSPKDAALPCPAINTASSLPRRPERTGKTQTRCSQTSGRRLEDIFFHLVIAASKGEDLKRSSRLLKDLIFVLFRTSEHLLPWYLSHPAVPISSSKHLKAGSSLLNPICTPGGWLMANPLQEVPPRWDARCKKKPDRGAKYKPRCYLQ